MFAGAHGMDSPSALMFPYFSNHTGNYRELLLVLQQLLSQGRLFLVSASSWLWESHQVKRDFKKDSYDKEIKTTGVDLFFESFSCEKSYKNKRYLEIETEPRELTLMFFFSFLFYNRRDLCIFES